MRLNASLHRRPFALRCLVAAAAVLAVGPWSSAAAAAAAAEPVQRNYDVADLLTPVPDFADPPTLVPAGPDPRPVAVDAKPIEAATPDSRARELATWLSSALKNGDAPAPAAVAVEGKALVVTADEAAQALATSLIERLRAEGRTQVSIEARHLTVDGGLAAIEDPSARELIALATSPDRPAVPLTEVQVNLLLRAAGAVEKTVVISAPRMTLFNHQRAFVLVATHRAYVAGHDEVKAKDGKLSFEPRIETASAGLVLDARAAVAADRRSVALDVRYEHARLLGLADQKRLASDGTPLTVQVPNADAARTHRTLATTDGETTLVYLGRAAPAPAAAPAFKKRFGADVVGDMFLLVKATVARQQVGRGDGVEQPAFPLLKTRVEP